MDIKISYGSTIHGFISVNLIEIFFYQSRKTDCNHIFLNFVPTLTLTEPGKVMSQALVKGSFFLFQ